MTTALVPLAEIHTMAKAVASSGLFGVKTAEQALALMLIAQAEGRHPALAARDYDIIQGKPAKKTEAMLRDFLEQQGKVEWHQLDDTIADATFSHPSGGTVRIAWDMKRAKQAGLGGKDMWSKYPRQMLRSRTVSEGIRTVCPMATSGMYVPEELRDIRDEKVITPSSGIEETLTAEEITQVGRVSVKMHEWLMQGSVGDAAYEMENANLNAEQQIYLWTHFDSKERSAMKKEQAAMKKRLSAPTLQPSTAAIAAAPSQEGVGQGEVAETITDAARKRLEARITELHLDREQVKAFVLATFAKQHFADLTKDEYAITDGYIDLRSAKDMGELQAVWTFLSKDDKITLAATKDARKSELESSEQPV